MGLPGFSDNALKTHFALYEGYVKNTNKLCEELKSVAPDSPQHAEMKRRYGWEFNGMRLHEYYFSGLSKNPKPLGEKTSLFEKIKNNFGGLDEWEKEFRAVASIRGIGWGILYYDSVTDRLTDVWVNEHDQGHLAGLTVLLNIDVFEHAFILDYGTKRADYIDAFMKIIDWETVEKRFESAKKS